MHLVLCVASLVCLGVTIGCLMKARNYNNSGDTQNAKKYYTAGYVFLALTVLTGAACGWRWYAKNTNYTYGGSPSYYYF